jgi:hypothetical protein
VHAIRVAGTVIGVIESGGTYTPVYRYTTPDGQTHEAKSNTGSGWTRGKETGRVVSLMIAPHNPAEAEEAGSHLFDLIGLALLAPGVWLAYTALTAYPVTWMTWVMAVALLIYLFERGHRILIPKGQRLSLQEWRRQRGLDPAVAIDLATVKPIESLAATPEMAQKQQTQAKNNRKAAPIVALFAVALLGAGVFQARSIALLESTGLRVDGTVVSLKGEWSSGSGRSHYNYFPIVRYRTQAGATVEFKDSVGSNPPSWRPGDKVTVLYRADTRGRDAIIDRGLFWNWAIPVLLFVGGALLAWLFLVMWRSGAWRSPADGLAAQSRA